MVRRTTAVLPNLTVGKSGRMLGFSGHKVKPRCWAVKSFCMQFGNQLESGALVRRFYFIGILGDLFICTSSWRRLFYKLKYIKIKIFFTSKSGCYWLIPFSSTCVESETCYEKYHKKPLSLHSIKMYYNTHFTLVYMLQHVTHNYIINFVEGLFPLGSETHWTYASLNNYFIMIPPVYQGSTLYLSNCKPATASNPKPNNRYSPMVTELSCI